VGSGALMWLEMEGINGCGNHKRLVYLWLIIVVNL